MSNTTKTKVLIVDDADSLRMLLRTILSGAGYEVVGQHSRGLGLMEMVAELKPDILCLDYHLPDTNGLELLEKIHEAHPEVAVVMITADVSPETRVNVTKAGASGFITKPFTEAIVVKEIDQVAQAQQLLAKTQENSPGTDKESAKARAVIADDSQTMRLLLSSILAHINIDVIAQACDGLEAVNITLQQSPDFVCLDIEMPEMDGLEALQKILEQKPDTKALIISSTARRECVTQAIKMGAKGYILKPYQPLQVVRAVMKLVE